MNNPSTSEFVVLFVTVSAPGIWKTKTSDHSHIVIISRCVRSLRIVAQSEVLRVRCCLYSRVTCNEEACYSSKLHVRDMSRALPAFDEFSNGVSILPRGTDRA